MDIDHRVDPELRKLLEMTPPTELNHENLAATREMQVKLFRQTNAQLGEVEGVSHQDRMVPGPAGDPEVRVRIYKRGPRSDKKSEARTRKPIEESRKDHRRN